MGLRTPHSGHRIGPGPRPQPSGGDDPVADSRSAGVAAKPACTRWDRLARLVLPGARLPTEAAPLLPLDNPGGLGRLLDLSQTVRGRPRRRGPRRMVLAGIAPPAPNWDIHGIHRTHQSRRRRPTLTVAGGCGRLQPEPVTALDLHDGSCRRRQEPIRMHRRGRPWPIGSGDLLTGVNGEIYQSTQQGSQQGLAALEVPRWGRPGHGLDDMIEMDPAGSSDET
ncbi:uncharacterized protein CDV56_100272 [Aspergillus thermomutatus]|uniref:Uncharacterized protein n=1 Tax=Aspergillus thermomutatus TaxID=41047 RepID=A0A397FYP3_ASPTH|nr:uncharacterized protein CDV56_100272 [Aspergillus thermomutatus]RHZ43881.1 hypothetical protein CDV56_100272 [Aspergillus thermomutatus]